MRSCLEWLRPASISHSVWFLCRSLPGSSHHLFLFSSSAPRKDKLQIIKVCFAANLPNTMLTPPVMRSLLCISQISRGMSLRAYTFNWLRQASSHVIWNKDSWVFSEGHDFWTTYLTSSNKILLSFGWINKRVSHWGYSLMRNHLFGFYNSQPLWAAVIDASQCLYSTWLWLGSFVVKHFKLILKIQ